MKYTAIAATLVGAVLADSAVWDPVKVTTTTTTTKYVWEAVPKPTTTTTTTTTKKGCSYVTEVPVKKCHPKHPDWCVEEKSKTTLYADKCTWADWEAHKPEPTTTGKCSYVTEVPVKKCVPGSKDKCWEEKTKTTYYADVCTWANWEEAVKATETKTVWETYKTGAVVTTTVKADWSDKDGWFGPKWTEVKTGCAVNVVTSYGAPIWKPVPEAPATTWAPVVVTTKVPVKVVETPSPVPAKPADKGHAVIAPNGNKWSMTYSPYTDAGKCKTEEQIKIDIKKLASLGFVSVRVYGTKCKTLEYVGKACEENKVKMIVGVFIDKTGIAGAKSQVAEIKAWGKWELVELIVIGNEAIFQGFCKAEELVAFIEECKWEFKAAGYTGSCTTTEPLAQWQQYGAQFCKVVDVVSANLYAYFNKDCPAENAGEFIKAQVEILKVICKDKETYVMESGWPSEGQCNGKACPGKDKQAIAIKKIKEVIGPKVVFFSFEDELWKAPGQFGVEQHWGCADVFAGEWDPVKPTTTTTTVKPTATSNWTNQ